MTIDLNKCRVSKTGNIITPKGRMLYPALLSPSMPKGETDEAKAKYQVTLLLPKAADISLLVDAVNTAITEKWGADATKKFKIKRPFLKTEEQGRLSDYADDFPVMIRVSTKDRPGVVYANNTYCSDDTEIYGGRWACASVRAYCYDHPTGGKGVSLGLVNVQLFDHDERMGGGRAKPEDEFEPVAGATGGGSTDSIFE